MLCAVSKQHKVAGCCLQHSHAFDKAHDRYYLRNRNLAIEEEGHVMGDLEIFGNAEDAY